MNGDGAPDLAFTYMAPQEGRAEQGLHWWNEGCRRNSHDSRGRRAVIRNRLLLALAAFLVVACGCQRFRFVYEVPDGYVGWVTVSFGGACAGERRSVFDSTLRVGPDGRACSGLNKHPRTTWVSSYYVDQGGARLRELRSTGWGEGGMVWAQEGSLDGRTMRFFVGTEEQLRASWKAASEQGAAPQP
jgi:hypothetical protein